MPFLIQCVSLRAHSPPRTPPVRFLKATNGVNSVEVDTQLYTDSVESESVLVDTGISLHVATAVDARGPQISLCRHLHPVHISARNFQLFLVRLYQ